jgi:hypothetical protein
VARLQAWLTAGGRETDPEDLVSRFRGVEREHPALVGLTDVDWLSVSHAHGENEDVPAYLRALTSDNRGDREFALQLLFETIWHQGDVYEASACAVPFLYNLLESKDVRDKAGVAQLLASIATGRFENEQIGEAIKQRISERIPLLYPYLQHPEPYLREKVARAIESFPEHAASVRADLDAAVREEPPYNVLFAAVEKGDIATIRWCLKEGGKVNECDPRPLQGNGMSLLHLAAREGHVEIARLLIASGADVNARCRRGWTPLMHACVQGKMRSQAEEVVRSLLAAGADPNARNDEGEDAIGCLGEGSSFWGLLRLLLDAGANIQDIRHN